MSEYHRPIMVNEVLEGLNVKDGGVYFDGTAGGGGHSFAILASNPTVRLIATDKDGEAICEVTKRLQPFQGRFKLFRTDFKNFAQVFEEAGIEKIDVSGNSIDSLISLRYLAVFQQLHTFTVGLLDVFKGLKVLQYVKHLCPSIEYFDDVHCADVEEPDFDTERLIDILVSLNEEDLEDLLSGGNIGEIAWEEPAFVQYEEDTFPTTPIRVLQDRIQAIEEEIAKQADDGV